MRKFWDVMGLMFDAVDAGSGGGESVGGGGDVASVISDSIAGMEGAEAPAPDPAPEPEGEEAELSKLEKEWQAQNPNARGNIAIHRHQAVLTRSRNQWAAEKKALEEAHKKAIDEYGFVKDPQFLQGLQLLMLAEENPRAFAELLAGDDRFKDILSLKDAQAAAAAQAPSDRPGPNKLSEDGKYKFYDEEGLGQLMAWERAQAVKEAREAFAKEFGPIKQEYEQRNAWNGALESQRKVLEGARSGWPGFKENEPAIKQAMLDHQEWELHDAYRHVVMTKALSETKADRDRVRQELMAELNKKPAAASSTRPGAGVGKEAGAGEQSVQDLIRASLPKER